MTTKQKDYSNYLGFLSNLLRVASLLAGFTLTVVTLLITLLPPNFIATNIFAQITLFFLAFTFDLIIFLVAWGSWFMLYFCQWIPPRTRTTSAFTGLAFIAFHLAGIAILLMFFFLNLILLFIAATITWVIFAILNIITIYRPLSKFRETRAHVRGTPLTQEKET